ncbi:MAG TPA: hypothetical protein VF730_08795 [Terracidiphilus sp.]
MRIFTHLAGVVLLCCVFLLGKLMVDRRENWAIALSHSPDSGNRLCNFFLYGGRTVEWVAAISAFLEAVAVMILMSGWVIDLVVGMAV